MALIEVDWRPGARELRQFAAMFLVFAVLFGTLFWLFPGFFGMPLWVSQLLWGVGPVVGLVGLALPAVVWPLYVVMMAIALPIGMVVSTVLMVMIYFLVLTPIGLIMRVVGYDPMQRKFQPQASTYWIRRTPPADAGRYFRQF